MGLWDESEEAVGYGNVNGSQNIYVDNPEQALKLVTLILSSGSNNYTNFMARKLANNLDYSLFNILKQLDSKNESHLIDSLYEISCQLDVYQKIKALKNKTIIGIAGQFSAGKSKFINSLLDIDKLPEDQIETTAIATYITKADNHEDIIAYTKGNGSIKLDESALLALTHAFYEKYKIGFSAFVDCLIVYNKTFKYNNIAILDTPGYSKYDSSLERNLSDKQIAFEQLRGADYIIWLIDIHKGVMQESDIAFLNSLQVNQPVLIVFNKADKLADEDIEKIINLTESMLKDKARFKLYGVTAYSALDIKESLGRHMVDDFFKMVNDSKNNKRDINFQYLKLKKEIEESLKNQLKNEEIKRNELGNFIFKSDDFLHLRSLTQIYSDRVERINRLYKLSRDFRIQSAKIENIIYDIHK